MTHMEYKGIKRHIKDQVEYTPAYVNELTNLIDAAFEDGSLTFDGDKIEDSKSPSPPPQTINKPFNT